MDEIVKKNGETQTSQCGTESGQKLLLVDQLTILGEAFGQKLTDERMRIYCADLADLTVEQVWLGCGRARRELKFFPKIAELRELAGVMQVSDGRPGVEQAWAMCPKSEDSSVVWTQEISTAFGVCRELLANGDQIGARMAFKEVYAAELERVRASGMPARWTASLGWDKSDRVRVLAEAVLSNRIHSGYAMSLLAPEQQDELMGQLPAGRALTGAVERRQQSNGIAQILHRLRETNSMPADLAPLPAMPERKELSPEEWAERRRVAKEQAEKLMQERQ